MSYYHGDFYQGDPGFFSFLGKAAGMAASFMPGVGGTAGKLITKLATRAPKLTALATRAGGMIAKHPVLSAAGAAGTIGLGSMVGGGRRTARMGSAAVGPAQMGQHGFHISKRTGGLVRNRRMHVTNVKALRRAIRRCTGFAHLAKRVLRFTSPRPPKGRAVFKARRRKRTV